MNRTRPVVFAIQPCNITRLKCFRITLIDLGLDKDMLKSVISKKRTELAGLRTDVQHLRETFQVSERRACELVGIAVSTFRYTTVKKLCG